MKKFFVGIKGVIVDNGSVLLLRTYDSDGRGDRWEFPGGRIDGDESVEQALARELQEEIPSIEHVRMHELLHAFRLPKDIKDDTSLFLVFYRVSAEFPGGISLSEEHVDARWFSFDDAYELVEDGVKPVVKMLEGSNER